MTEPEAIARRYARRTDADRYSLLRPEVWHTVQERQRAMLRLFARLGWQRLDDKTLLEVGCGSGGNLLEMLRLGFAPGNLAGIELLPERFEQARAVLPEAVRLVEGDALTVDVPVATTGAASVASTASPSRPASYETAEAPPSHHPDHDIVLVSTVFSSLLDDAYQARLAQKLWRWVRPGGGVLWYDFTVNNPRNPDVRGVPMARVRALFSEARVQACRVTLAPPLARAVCAVHPTLYTVLNTLPLWRTHRLAWLAKTGRPMSSPPD